MGETPTPARFYVHDDLTEDVRERHGAGSPAFALAAELMALVRRDPHVTVLTLPEQLAALVARGPHAPFTLAVGIGRAGVGVSPTTQARRGARPASDRGAARARAKRAGASVCQASSSRPADSSMARVEARVNL